MRFAYPGYKSLAFSAPLYPVIPAKAGIQADKLTPVTPLRVRMAVTAWIPAFAGMTVLMGARSRCSTVDGVP